MKNRKMNLLGTMVSLIAFLSTGSGFAYAAAEGSRGPALPAKAEMVRKQQEQRVTPAKRKAAAEALKAERLKIHQARQAAQQSSPEK